MLSGGKIIKKNDLGWWVRRVGRDQAVGDEGGAALVVLVPLPPSGLVEHRCYMSMSDGVELLVSALTLFVTKGG